MNYLIINYFNVISAVEKEIMRKKIIDNIFYKIIHDRWEDNGACGCKATRKQVLLIGTHFKRIVKHSFNFFFVEYAQSNETISFW